MTGSGARGRGSGGSFPRPQPGWASAARFGPQQMPTSLRSTSCPVLQAPSCRRGFPPSACACRACVHAASLPHRCQGRAAKHQGPSRPFAFPLSALCRLLGPGTLRASRRAHLPPVPSVAGRLPCTRCPGVWRGATASSLLGLGSPWLWDGPAKVVPGLSRASPWLAGHPLAFAL